MKKCFKDFYGGTASINKTSNGYRLKITDGSVSAKPMYNKVFKTERGCRIAMGKFSDGWQENRG